MSDPRQLPLTFPENQLGFDDMALTAANRGAVAAARRVDHWPYSTFCVVGPERSGLTTLVKAWVAHFEGVLLDPDLEAVGDAARLEQIAAGYVAIDRSDLVSDERRLLALVSAVERLNGRLLCSATTSPAEWRTSLSPDLMSRLKSAPIARIEEPDEDMMRERLRRAAARSMLTLTKNVEDYLVLRLGLSYLAIEDTVQRLAGATGSRALTVPLAKEVLEFSDEPGDPE
ncbi:MAG: hypothetical protein QNI84_06135 [Henriciella sp.]|nr:hypothetical protein [Henriciella sp.]